MSSFNLKRHKKKIMDQRSKIMDQVAKSKGKARDEQLQSGLIPRAKTWGGKENPRDERQKVRKELRDEF